MPQPTVDCRRFLLPREESPELSDDGFLVDPESEHLKQNASAATPFESVSNLPVLILLGEPGMGKSTTLRSEHDRIAAYAGDRVFWSDLGICGSDDSVHKRVFEAKRFRLRVGDGQLHAFLDGIDECLGHVGNLVGLLIEYLAELPRSRLSLRIGCRTAEWPADLEAGLHELWDKTSIGIYQLAPLRLRDVRTAADASGVPADEFLEQVSGLGAGPLASRPITLKFLLNCFKRGGRLPSRKTDLYRDGCQVLCDEWRDARKRGKRLSFGQRFAVASRLAYAIKFSGCTAFWTGPRHDPELDDDVRMEDLLGGNEHFKRESVTVELEQLRETLDTGLFRSRGPRRLGFSHETYAEYLAAQYLVDRKFAVSAMLRLIFHEDHSGKVVPQLRDTVRWLAALVPEVFQTVLAKDPESLFVADDLPLAERDRTDLVRRILQAYDSGELFDERTVRLVGNRDNGARLNYPELANDLKPYIVAAKRRDHFRERRSRD